MDYSQHMMKRSKKNQSKKISLANQNLSPNNAYGQP
jgi:hypothetical protein